MKADPVMVIAWGGMAALAVAMGIGRFAFTPLLPMMERDAGVSLTQGGWLASANYLGYLIGALSPVWIKVRAATMVRLGLLLTAGLTYAMGLVHSLSFWLALRGLSGIASAWVLIYTAMWALPRLIHGDPTWRSGLMFGGVGAGIAATGVLCLLLVAHGTASHTAWMCLGGLALLVSLFVWIAIAWGGGAAPSLKEERDGLHWTPYLWTMVICYGIFGFGYIIPATFLPVMARQTIHDPAVIGWFWPVFGLAAFGSTLLASSLFGRYEDRVILAYSFVLQALGVAAAAVSPTIAGTGLCALLVGGTFMVITMQGLREARRLAGLAAGRLMSVMTAAFAAGQMVGPICASYLVNWTGSFRWSLLTAAALMAGSAAMLLPKRSWHRASN